MVSLESRVSLQMCWIQSWNIMYLCWGKDCWTRITDWEPLVQNWVSPAVPTVMVVRRSSTEKIVVPAEPGLFFSVDRAQTIHRQGSTLSLTTWVLFTSSSCSLLYIVHEISLSAQKKTDVWQPIFLKTVINKDFAWYKPIFVAWWLEKFGLTSIFPRSTIRFDKIILIYLSSCNHI